VFAESAAMRLAARENSRLILVARGFEFAAPLGVLALGAALGVRFRRRRSDSKTLGAFFRLSARP
jgi:hypothetical protein